MKVIKRKVLQNIESNTKYYACTFYPQSKKYFVQNSYFDNCSFRNNVYFESLKKCTFDNCGFCEHASLSLSKMNIRSFPKYICHFTFLSHLDLSGNKFELLPCLEQLSNLKHLIAPSSPNNHFHDLPNFPQSVLKLKNLESLTISNVCGCPAQLAQLKNLRYLNIREAQLQMFPWTLLNLHNLTHLCLSSTDIKSIPTEIRELHNLTHLDLGCNNLSLLPLGIFELRNLQYLGLRSNDIIEIPDHISMLTSLRYLDFSFNCISGVSRSIEKLCHLQKLLISNNNLSWWKRQCLKSWLKNCKIHDNSHYMPNLDEEYRTEAFKVLD
ncbi:leucine-rich repeat domain-containing protein [Candidatus Uabimicrobium sp. HlEnr_7]|uniref:leucine-rich repeat domain-containing protein n=1 Tax=Candidatus Uabimicrobium helgolandensis TaxID=3095367 RepID=UPI003555F55E